MKESELKAAVEDRRAISERMWALLEGEQKVKFALDEMEGTDKERVDYLVGEIDKIWDAAPEQNTRYIPAGGVPYSKAFEFLQEHEQERAVARSEVLAKRAAADESVLAFRARFLGSEPLTPEQAQAFVTSLANQNLPVQWFDEHGVSFLEHTTQIRKHGVDYRGELIEFTIQPMGIECRVEKDALSDQYGGGRTLSVIGDPDDVIRTRRNHFSLPTPDQVNIAGDGIGSDLGYWRGFTGYVRTDSPLGALRDLGDYLTQRFRGWRSNQATRFVLTGEPPEERPLWMERGSGGEIIMHIAPWISPESVKNAYLRMLWFRGWMNERYGSSKAKRQRRLSAKNLKLLRFVTDRIDYQGRLPRGRDVVSEWDAEYPMWSYRDDTRTMWRDYNRALQQVAPSPSKATMPDGAYFKNPGKHSGVISIRERHNGVTC